MCYFGGLVAACAAQLTDPCLCQVSGKVIYLQIQTLTTTVLDLGHDPYHLSPRQHQFAIKWSWIGLGFES